MFFQVPSREIDKGEGKFWTHWNKDTKQVKTHFVFSSMNFSCSKPISSQEKLRMKNSEKIQSVLQTKKKLDLFRF